MNLLTSEKMDGSYMRLGSKSNLLESGEDSFLRILAGLTSHKSRFSGGESPLASSKDGCGRVVPPRNQIRQSPVIYIHLILK